MRTPTAVAVGAVLGVVATLGVLYASGWLVLPTEPPPAAGRQAAVHHAGHGVMPFDLAKTQHIFEMTERGGIEQVVARDPRDKNQIDLIRQHLEHEASRFARGDFSDPTALHGMTMPGIAELSADAAQMRVEYVPLPDGAQIVFVTDEPRLATAVHRWFGAQLSDHGADATYR